MPATFENVSMNGFISYLHRKGSGSCCDVLYVDQLLRCCSDSEDFDGHFNYRSVIGKLNYLEKSTRSDMIWVLPRIRVEGRPV
jgi:hypothetical protein